MTNNGQNIVYYKEFDIFNLKGGGLLKNVDRHNGVEVGYDKEFPIYIKYYKPKRTVTLIFEDSFYIGDNKPIYVYSTSNFNGGQPGKHKVYSGHYEEFKHFVYVSLTDTLICETKEVPFTKNFHFDLYTKSGNDGIVMTSKGEIDYTGENTRLARKLLYQKWNVLLHEKYKADITNPIIIDKLPPD